MNEFFLKTVNFARKIRYKRPLFTSPLHILNIISYLFNLSNEQLKVRKKRIEFKLIIDSLLGAKELPEHTQSHMRSVLALIMAISFLMSLSDTFYVLFVIDNIGFTLAATSTSVMLLTQLIFDYPSGSLGDWIGQRWVLAIAFICYNINFLLLLEASTFNDFLLIGIINGFGNAQSSGAFDTWIDNNYRKTVGDDDPERRTYGFTMSRINSMNSLTLGASFLLGGILATEISREFVFAVQLGLCMIVILLIILFIKDIELDEEDEVTKATKKINGYQNNKEKINGYFSLLIGGIKFLFQSKRVFFFIIGLSIYRATWLIWGNLILFPLYFGYTGSDIGASTLRTTLFFVGIPTGFFMANVSKKIGNERFSIVIFLQLLTFFPSFILLTYFVPISNEFNLIGIIGTFILLATLVGLLFNLGNTLAQRILLDLVPSENRNSVYSGLRGTLRGCGAPAN